LIIQIKTELGLADTTKWARNDFDGEGFNEEHEDYSDHGGEENEADYNDPDSIAGKCKGNLTILR
jgi:hypothetical protein